MGFPDAFPQSLREPFALRQWRRHAPDIELYFVCKPIPTVGAKHFCGTKPAPNHCVAGIHELGLAGFDLNVAGTQCAGD
jgi:hypothetical protein